MTLDELESFVCIASGGVTHAARTLRRSQPAISRRIHQLERSLDTALFERQGRSLRLSDAGRALLPYAEAVLAAVRDAERAARSLLKEPKAAARLHVAIVGTLADAHIVEALRRFRARFGARSITLRTAGSSEISALVRRGEADLGVRYGADPDAALESIALGAERLYVVVPAKHPIRSARMRDARAFAGETWLCFPPNPRQPESSQLPLQLMAAGVANPELSYVDSLTAQKRLVESGFGVALLPRSSFREELKRGSLRVVDVEKLRVEQPVLALRRKNNTNPLLPEFVALLEQTTPELLGKRRSRTRRTRS